MNKIAIVFPGQGSQSVGMLNALSYTYPQIQETFDEVSAQLGYDIWQLIQQGPETKLNQTEYTQVAMLVADVAVHKLLKNLSLPVPTFMAGHSLGEYAALVAAESLSLKEAAWLVEKRGQLMQETVPVGVGAMAAIVGLSNEQVESVCAQASNAVEKATPANYNALGQVVIAGHITAINKAIELAEVADAKLAKIIPVSVPCHCPLLQKAAEIFGDVLQEVTFRVPKIPVISNVNLEIYQSEEQIRRLLKEQLYSPVRWVETIQMIKSEGVEKIIECGPGKVLSGLIKRIDRSISVEHGIDLLIRKSKT